MSRRGKDLIALSADAIFPLINCGLQKRSARTLCMVFPFSRVADDTSPISLPKNSACARKFSSDARSGLRATVYGELRRGRKFINASNSDIK
jgi:hypothetical protein